MEEIEQCSVDVGDPLVDGARRRSSGAKRVSVQGPVRVQTFSLSSWGKVLVYSCCCCCCFLVLALVAAVAVLGTNAHKRPRRGAMMSSLERCPSAACRRYLHELRSSLNWKRNPCDDLYGFVCGRNGSVSVLAEHSAHRQALLSASRGGGAVGALLRSCLRRHRAVGGGLNKLSRFLAERGLHWPHKLTRPLLEVLVDLSVNWNMHLWFQLDIVAGDGTRPAVVLRKSPSILSWTGAQSVRRGAEYERWMRKALELFNAPGHKIGDMVVVAKAMNSLIASLLGAAAREPSPQQPIGTTLSGLSRYTGTARWLNILNERLTKGTSFTEEDSVSLYDQDVIRVSVHLAQLDSETVTGLALSVGFRIVETLGWMVDRRLETPPAWDNDRRTLRCLSKVQDLVGPAWYELLVMPRDDHGIVEAVRDVLEATKSRHHIPSLSFPNASELLPLPESGRHSAANFLSSWLALTEARAMARRGSAEPPLLKPHAWLFPFFHEELPAAVNFAGLGGEAARRLLPEHKSGAEESTRDREAVLVALSALRMKAPGPATVERLFFVASCLLLCVGSEGSPERTQPARRRCNGAVMPLPAFRHAFKCPRQGRYQTN